MHGFFFFPSPNKAAVKEKRCAVCFASSVLHLATHNWLEVPDINHHNHPEQTSPIVNQPTCSGWPPVHEWNWGAHPSRSHTPRVALNTKQNTWLSAREGITPCTGYLHRLCGELWCQSGVLPQEHQKHPDSYPAGIHCKRRGRKFPGTRQRQMRASLSSGVGKRCAEGNGVSGSVSLPRWLTSPDTSNLMSRPSGALTGTEAGSAASVLSLLLALALPLSSYSISLSLTLMTPSLQFRKSHKTSMSAGSTFTNYLNF